MAPARTVGRREYHSPLYPNATRSPLGDHAGPCQPSTQHGKCAMRIGSLRLMTVASHQAEGAKENVAFPFDERLE